MKKIISLSLIILLAICLVSTSIYATSSCKVTLENNKKQVTKDEEFSINVVISDIQDEKGIFGLSAVLEYDGNSLEYVKIEEEEGWEKPSYNKDNGKITILREEHYATTKQTVFKLTFKAKVENKENVVITLKDVRTSNGIKDIKLGDLKNTITIKTNNGEDNENPGDNNDNNDNNNPGDNNNDNNNPGDNNGNNNKPGDNNNNPGNNDNNNDNNNPGNNNNNNDNDNNNPGNNNSNINNVTNGDNSNDKNDSTNNDNIKDGELPKAGSTARLIVTGIVLFAIVAILLYTRIKKINKIERM